MRVNGGSADERYWRTYERPDTPLPEVEPVPEPTTDWRVYGDRYDPPGLKARTGAPTPVPAPPHGPRLRRFHRKGGPPGWRPMPLGKKIRAVVGGIALGGWAIASIIGGIVGDDSPRSQQAEAIHAVEMDMLATATLETLERKLLRETGSTRVTELIVYENVVIVQVTGDAGPVVYNWRGGRLITSGMEFDEAPEFDLADVDLTAIGRAGRRAQHLVDQPDNWWVTVGVADGGYEPMITGRAIGDGSDAKVTLTADGELADVSTS